jgi:transposase InsO family protein
VIKAAAAFKDQTTAPNQLWQTDFTYLKVTGWGRYYLSTVRDDFSRFIVAWKLCATMQVSDVRHRHARPGAGGLRARSGGAGRASAAAADRQRIAFHRQRFGRPAQKPGHA